MDTNIHNSSIGDVNVISATNHITARLVIVVKYVLSTMGVSKESISKFLIGNRFHVKLRILGPYSI